MNAPEAVAISAEAIYQRAVEFVVAEQRVSISLVQRELAIGYNQAARIIERMAEEGIVSADINGKRKVMREAGEAVNEERNPVEADIADAEIDHEELPATTVAAEFLLGDLIKAVTRRFKMQTKPWMQLSERDQQTLMGYVADDARAAVKEAVRIISSDNRVHFMAEVESVTFKDGVKSVLKTLNTPESHALADKQGGIVMIVIDDGGTYMEIGDACQAEPDQKPLFDTSTAGTSADTTDKPGGDSDTE
jgi:hypothetical protein